MPAPLRTTQLHELPKAAKVNIGSAAELRAVNRKLKWAIAFSGPVPGLQLPYRRRAAGGPASSGRTARLISSKKNRGRGCFARQGEGEFRSRAAKWPAERNPAKNAEVRSAPCSRQWGCRNRAGTAAKIVGRASALAHAGRTCLTSSNEARPETDEIQQKVAAAAPDTSDATD